MSARPRINFLINALMFLCAAAMGGIGFLLRYDLVTGEQRQAIYGSNVRLSLWGMERHSWGTIHLTIAFVLIGLLALHIILHWNMIRGLYRKLISGQKIRWTVGLGFTVVSALLLLFSFMLDPKVEAQGAGQGSGQQVQETTAPAESGIVVRGYMTLAEVSAQYGVPVEYLKQKLGIPESEPQDQTFTLLMTKYSFTLNTVGDLIGQYPQAQTGDGLPATPAPTESEIVIRGSMTLTEVAETYRVPVDYLKEKLGIPASEPDSQRLSWLRTTYVFETKGGERHVYA